jgi:hypothetical protein
VGQVVLPHKESIDVLKLKTPKNKVLDYERSTTPNEQAWKQQVTDLIPACDLKSRREIKVPVLEQYHCPKCHIGVVRYRRVPGNLKPIAECDNENCSWTVAQMTSAQRMALVKVDPDAIRTKAHMTGKERRMKQFLSKIVY